jgi:hypothetical protein
MLVVPFLVGVLLAGPAWVHLPLLVAWLGGYLLSYYVLLAVKTRRLSRVWPQVRFYAVVTVLPAALVLAVRPALLWFAPAFAALLGVNAWYAWRRDDRALVNDLASVVQGCLMVPVAAVAAGEPATSTTGAFLTVLLYFAGTVLYVKTMIRERGRASYLRASIGYHAAAVVAATALAVPLVVPFAWFLVRAAVLPRRALSPKQVGIVEILNSVALLVMVPALFR